jgi:alkylation response protein AidB-like acyl-CoA dehydrogenase
MNFDFGNTEITLRETIKALFDPDSKSTLSELQNKDNERIRETYLHWMNRLAETGYLALGLDDGKNNVRLLAAQESLAGISPCLFLSVEVSTRLFGRLVAIYGTPEQKDQVLPGLKEGRFIGAVALSEGGMSIENNPISTTGVPVNGGFGVSGSKVHAVNAPIADMIAVAGKDSGKGEKRLSFFLINKESEGLSIGERHSTLGYNGATTSPISLENCLVPLKSVIGPFQDKEPLKTLRRWEDEILTAASLGLMARSFDAASSYSKSHVSGGKPIIAYQEVGFKLAEMLTLFQTAQLLAYRAAWMAETGDREAAVLAHSAKVFCTESAEEVASHALQILGGYGYLYTNPAEESYRDAKYLQIAGTSSEISRMKIGDGVLERN